MSFFGGHIPVGKVIVGLLVDLLRVVHDQVCLIDDMTMFDGQSSKSSVDGRRSSPSVVTRM